MPARKLSLKAQLARLNAIGMALSAERNLEKLLETIVDEARSFTAADGGTLYLRSDNVLRFAVVQNNTLHVRMGGASGQVISWPDIPLVVEAHPNLENVCAYTAIKKELVNIPDVYTASGFDFSGARRFDATTGYRTKSNLTIPLLNHEDEVIGVLQLLNAYAGGEVVAFGRDMEALVASLASQAAVAITNAQLVRDTEALFESFVHVMASAIDQRSPCTAGHIRRVTDITLILAQAVNDTMTGPYADVHFSEDELNELRIAAWMHDVGKVTTPIHIVEKRQKLEAICDRIEMVRLRTELLKEQLRGVAREKLAALKASHADSAQLDAVEAELAGELAAVDDDMAFMAELNLPSEYIPAERLERLAVIAQRTYRDHDGLRPLLTADELENLSVQRGNVTGAELAMMREHAAVTSKLLQQIPFTRKLARVSKIAGGHHEKLNATGYPLQLAAADIPVQTRMLTIADVYEALTANDRSYKKPRTPDDALRILGFMARDGEIDSELLRVFAEIVVPHLNTTESVAI